MSLVKFIVSIALFNNADVHLNRLFTGHGQAEKVILFRFRFSILCDMNHAEQPLITRGKHVTL